MAPPLTESQVGAALANLGNFRVLQAQAVAAEGPADGIGGHLLLALGLRETHLKNINNPAGTDRGCFQISDAYHLAFLEREPGCRVGTWRAEPGHRASEPGYCPRYTPALIYALDMLQGNADWARRRYGLTQAGGVRFAVAAYNAGRGGATKGHETGDVDKFTTGADYSAWVLDHAKLVYRWINAHPNWKFEQTA